MAMNPLIQTKKIVNDAFERVWSTIKDHTFSVSVKNQIEIPEIEFPEVNIPEIPEPIDDRPELKEIVKTIIKQTQELKVSPDTSATKKQLLEILNKIHKAVSKEQKNLTSELVAEFGALRESLNNIGSKIPKTDLKPLESQIEALRGFLEDKNLDKLIRYDSWKVHIEDKQFEKLVKNMGKTIASSTGNGGLMKFAGGAVSSSNPLPVLADQKESTNLEGGGKVSVGTTAVEVTFTGTTQAIIIKADKDNTGIIYVGKSDVASDGSNAMIYLESEDWIEIDYNDVTNGVYVVSDTASQYFWKGALL